MGGSDPAAQAVAAVVYARMNQDGTLGEWKNTTSLPSKMMAHSTAASYSRVYVTGGWTGSSYLDTTYCADFLEQGGLTSWHQAPAPLPVKMDLHASVLYEDWLYVTGGWNRAPLQSVFLAQLQPDGCIDYWREIKSLPQTLYRHTALVFEGRIYVIGGRTQVDQPVSTVYVGTIHPNGGVTAWIPTTPLPQPRYYHAAFIAEAERKLYVLGGSQTLDDEQATVYSGYIERDGTIQNWELEDSLEIPSSLIRHAAVLNDWGIPYILGGRTGPTYQRSVYFTSPLAFSKSNAPPGPIHEGDVITYTLVYTNTSLVTQTLTLTDQLPLNVTLSPDSVQPPADWQGSLLVWEVGDLPPGGSDQVSFQVQVPLLPSLGTEVMGAASLAADLPPHLLPAAVACDTTRFWAAGLTRQPPPPGPFTLYLQLPPGANPSRLWLLTKGDGEAPLVAGQPARLARTSRQSFGASLWSAEITPALLAEGEIAVTVLDTRSLNAAFLFDAADPPFVEQLLDDFYDTTRTFTYTVDIPSVETQSIDVLLPLMDVTYWKDDLLPDSRPTRITMEFNDQSRTTLVNDPNLGNGLLLVDFAFTIGPLTRTITATETLTITVDTDDSVYTLGPRICRPVYIENTAWLCSPQAGCLSATAKNLPRDFKPLTYYLPIILRLHAGP